jgi:hypothetical protein
MRRRRLAYHSSKVTLLFLLRIILFCIFSYLFYLLLSLLLSFHCSRSPFVFLSFSYLSVRLQTSKKRKPSRNDDKECDEKEEVEESKASPGMLRRGQNDWSGFAEHKTWKPRTLEEIRATSEKWKRSNERERKEIASEEGYRSSTFLDVPGYVISNSFCCAFLHISSFSGFFFF